MLDGSDAISEFTIKKDYLTQSNCVSINDCQITPSTLRNILKTLYLKQSKETEMSSVDTLNNEAVLQKIFQNKSKIGGKKKKKTNNKKRKHKNTRKK